MTIFVVDTSVMIKWEIHEIDSDKAHRLRDEFRQGIHQLLSVDIFKVEAAHALTRAERQKRIQQGDAKRLLASILTESLQLFSFEPLMNRAIDISSAMRIGVYDCLYIALAEQEKCEFVTADDKLFKTLGKQFSVVQLASF